MSSAIQRCSWSTVRGNQSILPLAKALFVTACAAMQGSTHADHFCPGLAGVSSIGALDFRLDEWRVDVAVTGSQKALSLPTGLAVMAASPKVSVAQIARTHILIHSCCGTKARSGRMLLQVLPCGPSGRGSSSRPLLPNIHLRLDQCSALGRR